MEKKGRETEAIESFGKAYESYCTEVGRTAQKLIGLAQTAEANLKDEVGKKSAEKIEAFAKELIRA